MNIACCCGCWWRNEERLSAGVFAGVNAEPGNSQQRQLVVVTHASQLLSRGFGLAGCCFRRWSLLLCLGLTASAAASIIST